MKSNSLLKDGTFVIEQIYPVEISKVWKAITDKEEMKIWYFDLQEFKPEVGFKFQFLGGSPDGRAYLHLCQITEVIGGKKLAHSWRYDGYSGNTLVTFELFELGTQTLLKLTHEGLDSFPSSNKDFAKENFAQGWTWIIGTSLKKFLDQTTP